MSKRLSSIPLFVLVVVLCICTQLQAQVLYETDFIGDSAMTDWITTDNAWTHDPVAGTLTVTGAVGASAAYYDNIELTDFTVIADVEVNNSAAAVVARFTSLTDAFYMCRYHPQDALLQLYLINPTTLLASLPLAEMPELDPVQAYTVSITVKGNSITGSLIQGDVTYSVQATDDTATSGFGGMRVFGGGENVFSRFAISGLSKALAETPHPAEAGTDVPRQVRLSWTPGEFAVKHDVYMGGSFEDVNSATEPIAAGLDVNSFDPGRLEFGQDYFWRVDEVNGTPDKTVFKGTIWSFQVEPYSIQIPVDVNRVTASSSVTKNPASLTVDGSGLVDNAHSTVSETMWLSAMADLEPWIMYEFDRLEKLDKMLIWNSNSASEGFVGWGIKDVTIEYSNDAVEWTALAEPTQLDRAPGLATFDTPQAVDFGGVSAKYVKLNIQNNWGGILMQYGLSEVKFYGIPMHARQPVPASGSGEVRPDAVVTWRAGREAGQHTIYVSGDSNAVAQGTAPSESSMTNSADLKPFDLAMSQTYYWRVDEVNEAEATPMWAGPVWSFSTVAALTVDDFESYSNLSPDRPFQTWLDGFGYSADEFFPVEYGGNGTGAGVGHDIWSPSSPHYNGTIMETSLVYGGSQSMPFYYSNTGGAASETQRTFDTPQDWTVGGIKSLSLAVRGEAGNTGQLYLKINNAKVVVERVAIDAAQWQMWTIELSTVSTDLTHVTALTLGIDGSGASGTLYLDDIRLYPTVSTGIDIGSERTKLNNGGTLASQWIRSDSPEDIKGGAVFIGGLPSGADLRGLFTFSLAVFKPGDVISDATVSLFHGANGSSNHTDGSIQSSSLELSVVTNPAYVNNRASWNHADQDTLIAWTTPGGDFGATLTTVTDLDLTTIDTNDEVAFDGAALTAAVQAAVDAGDSRITFILRSPDLEAGTTRNFFVFNGASGSPIGPNLHVELE
ncbi:MAG: discoidin domain-containing protein [Phycisphaerae bacterium]|nr:discoidin domain-containing protein [Phycisphaerae bacterium]